MPASFRTWTRSIAHGEWSGTVEQLLGRWRPRPADLSTIPFSVWSSRTKFGEWARRHKLFLIRAELSPPSVLRELHQELDRASNRQWANGLDGLNRVLEDPEARQLHLGLLPPAPPEKDPMYEHHVRSDYPPMGATAA